MKKKQDLVSTRRHSNNSPGTRKSPSTIKASSLTRANIDKESGRRKSTHRDSHPGSHHDSFDHRLNNQDLINSDNESALMDKKRYSYQRKEEPHQFKKGNDGTQT